jgi:hypothetical protein
MFNFEICKKCNLRQVACTINTLQLYMTIAIESVATIVNTITIVIDYLNGAAVVVASLHRLPLACIYDRNMFKLLVSII